MPVVSIIYASASGIIGQLARSDTMDELAKASRCQPGEALIILDPSDIKWKGKWQEIDQAAAQAMVDSDRGKPANPATCAIIDNATGEVIGVIVADPSLAQGSKEVTLFPDANACIGCTFDAKGNAVPPVGIDAAAVQ